jgi:hypothetical protein
MNKIMVSCIQGKWQFKGFHEVINPIWIASTIGKVVQNQDSVIEKFGPITEHDKEILESGGVLYLGEMHSDYDDRRDYYFLIDIDNPRCSPIKIELRDKKISEITGNFIYEGK